MRLGFFSLLERNITGKKKTLVCLHLYVLERGKPVTSAPVHRETKEKRTYNFYSAYYGFLDRSVMVHHEPSWEHEASFREVMGRKTTLCFYPAPS